MKDWRKELQTAIEQIAVKIHDNAEKLADQPDYMVEDYKIIINISSDMVPTYTVKHTHI